MASERENRSSEIDSEFYKKLCEVVGAGTFDSISFSPWHKGCDTDLNATCDWPELENLMEDWYYEIQGDIEMHNYAIVTPELTEDGLVFEVFTQWNHCADDAENIQKAWDEDKFQEFVFGLLPKRLQNQVQALYLTVSLEIEYENPKSSSMSNFSIWLGEGEVDEDLAKSISPDGLQALKEYINKWCLDYFVHDGSFSASLEDNQISSFTTCASEAFLMIPGSPE